MPKATSMSDVVTLGGSTNCSDAAANILNSGKISLHTLANQPAYGAVLYNGQYEIPDPADPGGANVVGIYVSSLGDTEALLEIENNPNTTYASLPNVEQLPLTGLGWVQFYRASALDYNRVVLFGLIDRWVEGPPISYDTRQRVMYILDRRSTDPAALSAEGGTIMIQ